MPMVTTTCGLTVRRIGRFAGGQGVVGQLHEGVAELLGAGAQSSPAGRLACTIDSSAACTFSPPTASRSKRPVTLPSACLAIVSDRPSVGSGSGPSGSSRAR